MKLPENLLYTKKHEWILKKDNILIVGITDYAQSQLGDIVYTELPVTGTEVIKGKEFGVVESVKAVSDIYAPASGKVVKINEALKETPGTLNQDPYDRGWMIYIEPSNPKELEELLTHKEYQKLIHS